MKTDGAKRYPILVNAILFLARFADNAPNQACVVLGGGGGGVVVLVFFLW
jgi:hypothetical protein